MNIGTWLFTTMYGRRVGEDSSGNIYYEDKRGSGHAGRARRWVAYKGSPEASAVPPEWHAWLHYTVDAPLPADNRRSWQKPHQANPTGTVQGYRPPGHAFKGGKRDKATGDYEAWSPGN